MNEKFCISIQISLKFVPNGPNDNESIFVQVMAWHQTGDKLLLEPMLTQFTAADELTHWALGDFNEILDV